MSLAALGMDGVPALDPLSYPGRTIDRPALLSGSHLFDLTPSVDYLGGWHTRHPVIAIGSNASPGQLHYKLSRLGLPVVVPMTTLRVSGLGVGVSAHVGRNGYVANSPFVALGGEVDVVLTLLDAAQLRAVDATELPRYRRVRLSGTEFPMVLPSGERLTAAYLYVNAHGVLAGADGKPRLPGAQALLLAELLERSAHLRELFDSPQDWVTKCRADAELRGVVKRIFHESGWILPQERLLRDHDDHGRVLVYGEVSSL